MEEISIKHCINSIVNNAGIALPQPLGKINLNETKEVLALNLLAPIQITQFFAEKMKENRNGRIINIASRAIQGAKSRTSYSAAKSGLIGCTRTWALELAEFNITVNAIAPGPIETELFRKTRPVGSQEEQETLKNIPMKRLGKPEEVASLIAFLLSDEAGYITGQTIFIDGGKSI
jgi:NAD(P)-dependent dehydrogenase (short-subunit alcohol dehydrogenase family)